MNTKMFVCLSFCLGLITLGCSKDGAESQDLTQSEQGSVSSKAAAANQESEGATQISGVGLYAVPGDNCNHPGGAGATFVVSMTGDLEGCLYTFVDDFECSPSGTYREEGRELFVGTYKGQSGTFWTGYEFEGKYEGCPQDGEPLGAEIFGRCQHPIEKGSGTGFFAGVTGRLGFKDNVELLIFPYRGHLKF
jgi:hypothetical protein